MARTTRLIRYTIPRELLSPSEHGSTMNQTAVLDMMRYDGARVIDHNSETITLASEVFTRDRWSSFGIYPTVVGEW